MTAIPELEQLRLNRVELRRLISSRQLAPYAYLEISPKPSVPGAISEALRILEFGWSLPDGKLDTVVPPIPWEGHLRSFDFHLHAWMPVQSFLLAFDVSRQWKFFEAALAFAEDWLSSSEIQPKSKTIVDCVSEVLLHKRGAWWYDMAVAQRLQRLTYILDVSCREKSIDNARIARMMDNVLLHHAALSVDELYRSKTNHGFFQALNQLDAAKRIPELDATGSFLSLAARRLNVQIENQYTLSGFHVEHSPGYHYMVTAALLNARRAGLLDQYQGNKLHDFECGMSWMVKPSGNLSEFGDTDRRNISGNTDITFFEAPDLLAVLSKSVDTPRGVHEARDAGYAFARLYGGNVERKPENAAYLAQIAGFHSRVHKHADHLSFIWYDQGRDILIDPGRYAYTERTQAGSELHDQGFWYSDPKRIYVESTRAHNCIEVDGKNYLRNKVRPFGSALRYAGEQFGLAITDCAVTHFRRVRHTRVLVMAPDHFLLVLDWLYDRTDVEHDYRQWFHFDHDWQVSKAGSRIHAHHSGNESCKPTELTIASLVSAVSVSEVVRGQEEPELLGWLSDKPYSLIPSSCFYMSTRSAKPATLVTLFTFGKQLDVDANATAFNTTMRACQAVWTDERGRNAVDIKRNNDDRLTVRHELS